jgi:hypothetical protein
MAGLPSPLESWLTILHSFELPRGIYSITLAFLDVVTNLVVWSLSEPVCLPSVPLLFSDYP